MGTRLYSIIGAGAVCVAGTVFFKEVLQGWMTCRYEGDQKLDGKTVVLSGGDAGVGKEAAAQFLKRGARVIMASSDMDRCKKARKEVYINVKRKKIVNKNIVCEELDLGSYQSIREFADRMKKEQSIDYLINTAASVHEPKKTITSDGVERQMAVNHFGQFLLTNLLLDQLKASKPAKIILLVSVSHVKGELDFENLNWDRDYRSSDAYNRSQLATALFIHALDKRLKGTGVTVNGLYPGVVYDRNENLGIFRSNWSFMVRPFVWFFSKTARIGAQPFLYLALSEELDAVSGQWFSNCNQQTSDKMKEDVVAERLWLTDRKWTHLDDAWPADSSSSSAPPPSPSQSPSPTPIPTPAPTQAK